MHVLPGKLFCKIYGNSDAIVSEFLENLKEMFPHFSKKVNEIHYTSIRDGEYRVIKLIDSLYAREC